MNRQRKVARRAATVLTIVWTAWSWAMIVAGEPPVGRFPPHALGPEKDTILFAEWLLPIVGLWSLFWIFKPLFDRREPTDN